MHLMLWIMLEGAEDQDARDKIMADLRVEEWLVQRDVEQQTRVVPREEGAPAWWFGDEEASAVSQAAAVTIRSGGAR